MLQVTGSRAAISAQARTLLGVPFRFYGRTRERGIDCIGVVLITGWELGLLPKDIEIPCYPFPVSPDSFKLFDEHMDEADGFAEGRVVIWAEQGHPKHVAILTWVDRWRCIGIDWSHLRRYVTQYTPTGLDVWKCYDYRGVV